MSDDPTEACRLAQNLARNCGYRVFPCRDDKAPACPHGLTDATADPHAIVRLWRDYPGPLIGIATGAASGIDVLDIDAKHGGAHLWWRSNHHRLLPTRCYATRSGGLHLYYQHRDGIRNSQGKLCPGVDTRGDGGYVIHWFAAMLPCHDHSPEAPFPEWLAAQLLRQRTPTPAPRRHHEGRDHDDRILAGLARYIERVPEGQRNSALYWAGCRCQERGVLSQQAATELLAAARAAGLPEIEARRTINSARRKAP